MRKKYIKKLVVITLISTSLTVLSVGNSYAKTISKATVTANILNLREAPNTNSKVIGKLKKGNELKVLDSSGEWYKVSIDRLTGWVSAKYVNTYASTSNEPNTKNANSDTSKSEIKEANKTDNKTNVTYGKITGNSVNVRKGPGLSYSVIKQLNKGEQVEILEKKEKWFNVKLSDNVVGWVSSAYISEYKEQIEQSIESKSENQKQTANSTANVSDKVSDKKSDNEPDKASEKEWDISKTNFSGDQLLTQAEADYLNITESETYTYLTPEEREEVISELIAFAQNLVGVKYTYGGTSPETGFDCSGFTQYVFGHFGIKLERVAADQAKQGIEVKLEDLKPGDLVFSDTNGGNNYINHVGIYIGEGNFISATSG